VTQGSVAIDWLAPHQLTVDDLRAIDAFAAIDDEQGARFLAMGREATYAAGEAVTERWSLARTFSIVCSGRLSVRIADREVNSLGPLDHLGEIAAIDWGRDFSYGRTATVIATEPTRVVAFPAAALRELMSDNDEVDRAIRRTAQVRLATR
jgi:CRP-like cAMP-binding protein